MSSEDWEPLSPDDIAGLGRPVVASGFLRLNKPALALLVKTVSGRPAGYRDLTVLLGLLTRARFSGTAYTAADGAVPGTDAELARLIGVEPKAFRRAVDSLIYRSYLTHLPAPTAGYRVTRATWDWLQDPGMPDAPDTLDAPNPFAAGRPRRR